MRSRGSRTFPAPLPASSVHKPSASNQGHTHPIPRGPAPPSPSLPGKDPTFTSGGKARSWKPAPGPALCTPLSPCPLPRLPTLRARGLGFAGGARSLSRTRVRREPTDALRLGAARGLPASAGARGHTEVLLLSRPISPTDISGHHFIVC